MPTGRPKSFDADSALDRATTILWQEGVRGVSLNDLADRLGTSKPALARAFGGKDALTARVLERYHARAADMVAAALAQPGTVRALAARYLAVFVEAQTGATSPRGCLIAAASSDCAAIRHGPVRETLDRIAAASLATLEARLAAAGAPDPQGLARFLSAQTLAMSAMARSGASRADLSRLAAYALRAVSAPPADLAAGDRAPEDGVSEDGAPPAGALPDAAL